MPGRFFRKFTLKRDDYKEHWFLAPFSHLLHDPRLWSIRRRNVVPAFALGLLVAYLPLPGHVLMAALLALLFRINIPVAAVTTFVSNPLTIGPMLYLAYKIGSALLGIEPQPLEFELSTVWLKDKIVTIWQPILLGCLLLGSSLSIVGYVVLHVIWSNSLAVYLGRRRSKKLPND